MKVYIAGPMSGFPFYNFASFDEARDRLREIGHDPISPADYARRLVEGAGHDSSVESNFDLFQIEDFMERDIVGMRGAECVVLLPGWTNSKGAHVEIAYARYRGIPIYASLQEFESLVGPLEVAA